MTDSEDPFEAEPRPTLIALPGGKTDDEPRLHQVDTGDTVVDLSGDITAQSLADLDADLADDPADDVDPCEPSEAPYGTRAELDRTDTSSLASLADDLEYLSGLASGHEADSIAPRTRDAYTSDWRQYEAWCTVREEPALPVDPMLVRLYLADMAQTLLPDGTHRFKASTIERHLASLTWASRASGGERDIARHPRVAAVLAGIKRGRQEKPARRQPLLLDDVVGLVDDMDHSTWPSGVIAARDTFAILLGFATAMRRSEVAGLNIGDVRPERLDGVHIHLGATKTDQEGQGTVLGVPYGAKTVSCVPCARVRWLRLLAATGRGASMRLVLATGNTDDWKHVCHGRDPVEEFGINESAPLFRPVTKQGVIVDRRLTAAALNAMLKRRVEGSGYDPDRYGYHSLRAGFVTQARRNGADSRSVRRQTRHGSDEMVNVYDRDFTPLRDNAVNVLGM